MLQSAQIKELRKNGQLEEALELAENDLQENPGDIYAKRNMSWVYYEYIKRFTEQNDPEKFLETLEKVIDLELPENETMLGDNIAWKLGTLLFHLLKNPHVNYTPLYRIIDLLQKLNFTRPSEGYSFMLKAVHKTLKPNPEKYIAFIDWWNLENLRPEDAEKEVMPNGRQVMSVAEQVLTAYFKAKIPTGENVNREDVLRSVQQIDEFHEKYPKFLYLIYFKVKMLLSIGEHDSLLNEFIPFAQKKSGDFWVWDNLAEIYEDEETKMVCLAQAAFTGKNNEGMTAKVHEKLALKFIQKGMLPEAKWEIEKIEQIKEEQNHKIPRFVTEKKAEPWFSATESAENNYKLYRRHSAAAMDILYPDKPWEYIFINNVGKMANFVKGDDTMGFFDPKRNKVKLRLQPGDVLKVKFKRFSESAPSDFIAVQKGENAGLKERNYKEVQGEIRLNDRGFGFINDTFVPPKVVEQREYTNGQPIEGEAIRTFNKKKNQFGWTLV